jgi:hypothetical protein
MITPERFYNTEQPLPPRQIATELEGNAQLPAGISADNMIGDLTLTRQGIPHHGKFLGAEYGSGKLYVDVGQHLEMARGEALGPARAAVEDRKGTEQLAAIIDGSGYDHKGLYRTAGTNIPAGLSGNHREGGYSNGYHENSLVPREVVEDPDDDGNPEGRLFDNLVASSLASRLWAMGGALREEGFVFSQKVWGIGGAPIERGLRRRTDHGNKPMVMIPSVSSDADTIGDKAWARVEVRMADPGLSLAGRYLSFAATSLTLRLLELQKSRAGKVGKLDAPLDRRSLLALCLEDPVQAAKDYAADLSLTRTATSLGGDQLTALDVQEKLLEVFEALPRYFLLPKDELLAIEGIRRVVDAFRASRPQEAQYAPDALLLSDCAPRHRVVSTGRDPSTLTARDPVLMSRDLRWGLVLPARMNGKVGPEGLGPRYWKRQVELGNDAYDRAVEQLAAASALSERARRRAAMIDDLSGKQTVIDWAHYRQDGQPRSFGGPYGESDEQLLLQAA